MLTQHSITIIDTSVEESAEASFPITLHPPLPPTLTHDSTIISNGSMSPPTAQAIDRIPDPALGPVLISAAPPYSHSQSSGTESERESNQQLPVPISSVHSL